MRLTRPKIGILRREVKNAYHYLDLSKTLRVIILSNGWHVTNTEWSSGWETFILE